MIEKEKILKQLTEQMLKHRETLKLTQKEVSELLGKPEKTYQRWESTGSGLSAFSDIKNIFKVLKFSTIEIINLLELQSLTLGEVKELYQNEETLKDIRENTICSYTRQTCGKLESITIEQLLCILLKEYFKRKGHIFDD